MEEMRLHVVLLALSAEIEHLPVSEQNNLQQGGNQIYTMPCVWMLFSK